MKTELKMAYTEVLEIINHMEPKYKEKLPAKLLKQMEKNKLSGYEFQIDFSIPFEENKFTSKALALLALINLNYWCENETEKNAQNAIHEANDKSRQISVMPKLDISQHVEQTEIEKVLDGKEVEPFLWLELPPDTWFEKLWYRVKNFFRKRK